jgi:hypothetical protein
MMNLTVVRIENLTGKRKMKRTESYRSSFSIEGKEVRNPLAAIPGELSRWP